jgi:hypothetical protein
MQKFSKSGTLMECIYNANTPLGIIYKDPATNETQLPTVDDLLLSRANQGSSEYFKANCLSKIPYFPAFTRVLEPCPKCNRAITSLVTIGDDVAVLRACICGYKWEKKG